MRYVRAHDKVTGEFVEKQDAREKNEGSRRSHMYRCLNDSCGCTFHWRKETRPKENTEWRPPTFAKNPSSDHTDGCRYDYSGFAEVHRDVVAFDGDNLNLRVLFPMGGAKSDLNPWEPGMLTDSQRRAAYNNIHKKGFSRLRDLVDFIEENLGGLEDPALADLILHYQGKSHSWDDLWVASNNYKELIRKAKNVDEKLNSEAALTVVKPTHQINDSRRGNPRFVCEPQYARPDYKLITIKPVLVCGDDFMAAAMHKVIEGNGNILVASRPFLPDVQRGSDTLVYLSAAEISQLSQVKKEYWHLITGSRHQMDFHDQMSGGMTVGMPR